MGRARVKVSCWALSMTAIDGARSSVLLTRMRPPGELEFSVTLKAGSGESNYAHLAVCCSRYYP